MKTNLSILSLSSLMDLNIPKSLIKQLLRAYDNPYYKTQLLTDKKDIYIAYYDNDTTQKASLIRMFCMYPKNR